MTLKYEPDSREESSHPDGWPPAQLGRPRRPAYPVFVGVLVIVLFGLAGFLWWLLESTVPIGEYEAAIASLSAVEAELEEVSAENDGLGNEVEALAVESDRLERELADRSAESQRLEQRLGSLANVGRAIAILSMWYDPEHIAELRGAGLDLSAADQLMGDLGFNQAFAEWVESDNWQDVNRSMIQLPDERAQAAWDAFARAEIGSVEEAIAITEFTWRVVQLLLETLLELDVTTPSA